MKTIDFASWFLGFLSCALCVVVILVPHYEPDILVYKKAALPDHCQVGNKVIVTTPTPNEYYECEAHWVRR